MKNKVLILSTSFDDTSDKVIEWLEDMGCYTQRINFDNLSNFFENYSELIDTFVKSKHPITIWWRKFAIENHRLQLEDEKLEQSFNSHLNSELDTLFRFYLSRLNLEETLSLGKDSYFDFNNLSVLKYAAEVGIDIPNSIITTSLKDLKSFREKHKEIVVKCISDGVSFKEKNNIYKVYTSVVHDEVIDILSSSFFPSLFQEKINYDYEVKVFFIRGELFSMCLLNREKSIVDSRQADTIKTIRKLPYKLPESIENKLSTLLLEKLKLEIATVDILKCKGKYILTDVNPSGQFSELSFICNYFLEKKIATHLKNGNKR